MSKVKWIRLSIDIFDDEKIKLIDAMPERDAIFVIWVKLLVLAGKVNDGGVIYLTQEIPYTDEMLSTIFNRPQSIVRLALDVLVKLEMISILENQHIELVNWEKHQNIDGLDRIREQNRLRAQQYRKRLKENSEPSRIPSRDITQENKNRIEENKDSGPELKVRDPVIREYVLCHRKLYPGRPDPEIPFGKVGALLKEKRKRFSDEQLINIVRSAKDDSWIRKNDAYDLGTILAANVFNRLLRTGGESTETPPEPDTCPECSKPCIGGKCECGWGLQ